MTGSSGAGPAALPPGPMTETEFRSLYERLRGQLPWGPDDRRGARNYHTPAEILAALGEVTVGRPVSLAAPVEHRPAADNPDPAQHQMEGPRGPDAGPWLAFSMDRIAMNIHGNADSHVDALCHVIFDGKLYNGVAADTVTATGAAELSIGIAADGIVGRGVLLDVPRSRGVPWLEPGDHVTVAGVFAAQQGLGDDAKAGAGLHPTVLPLLAERRIAALGSDGNNDTAPSAVAGVDFPVHVLTVKALGLHLLDYLQFTELRQVCAEIGRWSFLCVIAALRLPTGTGSPVNPIAIV